MTEQNKSSETTREMSKGMVCAPNHGAAVRGAAQAAGRTNRDKQDDTRDVQARDNIGKVYGSAEYSGRGDEVHSVLCSGWTDSIADSRINFNRMDALFWGAKAPAVGSTFRVCVGSNDVPATVDRHQGPRKECTESEREGGNSGTVTRGFETSTR